MNLIAIDPGTKQSGVIILDPDGVIIYHGIDNNEDLLQMVIEIKPNNCEMALEMISSYGMPVGKEVFETCVWIGRLQQAFRGKTKLFYRREVKHYLCNSSKATDANIRQAIIDKYPDTGGGKVPQIGTKSQPGPLYGISKDKWSALGLALTFKANKEKSYV